MEPDRPNGSRTSSPFASRLVWSGFAAVLLVVVGAGLVSVARRPSAAAPLPDLGAVPPFQLQERSGRAIGLDDLRGSPWIADFIFTRCAGTCPLLTAQMARLQKKLAAGQGADVKLVSITVDPANDNADVLRRYAEAQHADPRSWLFLTGERPALHALIKDGFRLSVVEREGADADPNEMITHSDRFVLVDAEGRIRGYYHGTDDEGVARLESDLARLRQEQR